MTELNKRVGVRGIERERVREKVIHREVQIEKVKKNTTAEQDELLDKKKQNGK